MGLIRVLLADNHRTFVEALALRLRAEPGIEVVAAVCNDVDALRALAMPADVALLDVDLADRDGIALGRMMQDEHEQLRLVAVTTKEDVETAARALRAGFVAWVPKDVGVSVLLDVIRAVCRGETWIPGPLLTKLFRHLLHEEHDRQESKKILAGLTVREHDVLRWMATGASRAEIAERLFISPNTVRTHMQSILAKLGVHSSLAAVALARRAGVS